MPLPLAALLVQRGFTEAAHARAFLRPALDQLADPHALAGMAEAVSLITAAVQARTPILVHGDYDVDGQCATAVLTRALRVAGAVVHPFVPHRTKDGYDFGAAGVAEAARVGAGLILTCDCGTNAVAAVADAKALGCHVIITDHHLPGPVLPAADAIVNPQRADDRSGLGALCGTGIAFKLVQALVEPLGLPAGLPLHLLDYVALATVADVVPLVGENRILVKHGLKLLQETRWPGLRALLTTSELAGKSLRAGQVGFILAPRLNAVGRIADAKDGVALLLSDDDRHATLLAAQLERLNRERQALDQRIQETAFAMVERDFADPVEHPAIVLAGDGWHPGVIGIVASRVVERYGRPTFLIGLDGEVGKGSGRSIDGFDLHAALTACGDLLERYGGHRMAAGLTVSRRQVDAFRERFTAHARSQLSPDDLGPTQRVDLELPLGEVTDELERWGRHLEPCGMGNAAPVLGTRRIRLEGMRTVGEKHLKATLSAGGRSVEAIAFGWADRAAGLRGEVDVAFRLERNEFRGVSSLQARVLALAPTSSA
ncbi:MAG: single-stranded-DNA-specific exonuclease RecJ [Gemmatimonadales bacterium]|nr:single-stranded-DNA-specific exonuclease RecJ [Gemmatimonadales bacterium]